MSKYYALIFSNWLNYQTWVEKTNDDIVAVCSEDKKIIVTIKRNNKLNEGK